MTYRPALLLLGIVVLAVGCATVSYTEVKKPVMPKTEAECLAAGGDWTTLGLPYPNKPKVCDLKAADKGKPCTDSRQCQGICVPPEGAADGSTVSGQCSAYVRNYGNVRWVKDGKVESLNVE
jgi:hypothetical protein